MKIRFAAADSRIVNYSKFKNARSAPTFVVGALVNTSNGIVVIMTADARDYALKISEPLFRLTTESIRLRSNETRSHESLSSLIHHLADRDRQMACHDADILRQHLDVIPSTGSIAVHFDMSLRGVEWLETFRTMIENLIYRSLTSEDSLSLLLFDYVVEQKTARVLWNLGLDRSDAPGLNGGFR